MKSLSLWFYPAAWSFTTRLTIAMLLVSLLPLVLITYSATPLISQHYLWSIGVGIASSSLLISYILVKPIRLLTKTAHLLERGHFATATLTKVLHTPNDLGVLARAFSQLMVTVKMIQEQQINRHITTVLLQELNHRDLDWLEKVGQYRELTAGTILMSDGQTIKSLHLVLEGSLTIEDTQLESSGLVPTIDLRENEFHQSEIIHFGVGEVVGWESFLDSLTTTTVYTTSQTLVLSVSKSQLTTQLKQDLGFASRFYRAIAILLSNRLHNISQHSCDRSIQEQPVKDVLFMLSRFHDSDIDWLVAIGQRQKIPAHTILIQQGRPIDALYILLDGTLTVSTSDTICNPFMRAFSTQTNCAVPGQIITRLSKGEIVGETPFLKADLPSTTVTAWQDAIVLSIPRQQLIVKLYQDVGFAARFYQVLAHLMHDRLQEVWYRLGYVRSLNHPSFNPSEAATLKDELDDRSLDQMALAGTRFDWMLRRLQGAELI
ncbi:cyclic nucleotide-binding domain-containing protein [Pantanalinema rosaneae CENA516]|uniref:cyclic nucleotide-binding domain-containing protein n=1 Tax=Pantanalinema rosaneae TaxID=1620701 RepID=UPI003D6FB760